MSKNRYILGWARIWKFFFSILVFVTLFPIALVFAVAPSVMIFPEKVIQGEPVKIVVENVSGVSAVRKILFEEKPVGFSLFQGKPTALIGIDLNKKPGDYKVIVTFTDGSVVEKNITVGKREKIEAPLSIPEKLGGNTKESATKLVSTLSQENSLLNSLWSQPKSLWVEPFHFPIENPKVTDSYGYSRQTVGYSIAHKGTDFRASEGTKVIAMNRGVVRLVRNFRNYGKTVVIDHGLGLFSFYMHMSKIKVNEGELVNVGQVVGLSGQTGYAGSSHLHLTVRVQRTSVDPMKFMSLFE